MTHGSLKLVLDGTEYLILDGPSGTTTTQAIADLVAGLTGSFPTYAGSGSPEGVHVGSVGNSYIDTTADALYYKETGSGNTGWALIGSGGGGSGFDYTGSGSPEGVQSATVGKNYYDSTNGALWFKIEGSGNTGWVAGIGDAPTLPAGTDVGVGFDGNDLYVISGISGDVIIGDGRSEAGTNNVIYFHSGNADGEQSLEMQLGSTGQFTWLWNADGTTKFPGALKFDDGTDDYRITCVSGTMQLITRNHADPDANSQLDLSEGTAILAVSTDTLGADVTIGPASVVIGFQGVAGMDVERFGGDTYVGFYGVTPVVQAAHPTVLGDVIAILTDLGLCGA